MASGDQSGSEGKGPVLFVSHSYGYGRDLMYYGELFAKLRKLEPRLAIGVDRETDFANPHGLDLRPLYRRRSIGLPSGDGYARELHAASPALAARVAKLAPEVLVTIEFTPVSLLAMFGSLGSRGTKRVLLVESDPAGRGASNSSGVLAVKRRAVGLADAIRTNNEAGARYLVDTLGADSGKVDVGPYLTSRPPGPPVNIEQGDGSLRLLFANSLTERKNARVMIEALGMLDDAVRSEVRLTIVGDGDQRGVLGNLADERGVNDCVHFVGKRAYADLGEHYAAADVLVNPTSLDYRSLSSFEGLGYGLALLVSDKDGASRETVIEGKTGFTFAPDDSRALAGHIATLASDRDRLLAMRRNALVLYEETFSLERAAANIAATIARAREA